MTVLLKTHTSPFSRPVAPGMKKVSIGSSLDSHVKCVEDPGNVHCDHTAKQLGRTGHLVVTELAIWCNLSTSSLSSFPLFWQPSALAIPIELLSMNWTWNTIPNIYNKIATRLPRVRVQLNQGLMCVNSKGLIVTYLLARTCHIDLNPSPSMPCMFYKIGLRTPQMVYLSRLSVFILQ